MSNYTILEGDCLQVLPTLPPATCIFADPPDNLGLKYADQIKDKRPTEEYIAWLRGVVDVTLGHKPKVFWLSHYFKYLPYMLAHAERWIGEYQVRLFPWRFTFGQHRDSDFGNGFRPIIRYARFDAAWNTNAIRVPSARTLKYHDKRANQAGRVPDDVWDFPRVCGTFKERRPYHPNQHPEALMERIIRVSCMDGDSVIDLFGGTFTTDRVCRRLATAEKPLQVSCTSIELSHYYCQKYLDSLGQ